MNRILLLLIFVVSSFQLFAQFTQTPALVNISMPASKTEAIEHVVYTPPSDSMLIYWRVEKALDFNPKWIFFVCDLNLCYGPTIERCPGNKPNLMLLPENLFMYHFNSDSIVGMSSVTIKFYTDKNFTQEIHSTTININVTGVSSTKDLSGLNNLKVYPNPATDYFQISNTVGVKKIVVYNMFGKEVKSYFHYPNAQHEISELKTGMYIVKLINDKNKVVKSVKLNKIHSGV